MAEENMPTQNNTKVRPRGGSRDKSASTSSTVKERIDIEANTIPEVPDDPKVNDSPIDQVRHTVPITDNPSELVQTFRTWTLGLAACILLSFGNAFFSFRRHPISISPIVAEVVTFILGKTMAAIFPNTQIPVPLTKWSFSLNPGPFTMKEHTLIAVIASSGSGGVYAVNIFIIVKAFYRRSIHPVPAYMLTLATQMIGYGWVGIFRKFLVDSPYMWWPSSLVLVSVLRAFHEREEKPRGGKTRTHFFYLVFLVSSAYYIIPGYFFKSVSTMSIVCWIWKKSHTAQQIGSGLNGLGVGSFGLDWSTIASFGSPLAAPDFSILNILFGFVLFFYILLPLAYWSNMYNAKKFPLISSGTFDYTGAPYNVTRIMKKTTFDFDVTGYNNYSKVYLSVTLALQYGLTFATLPATISHVVLFHGKSIYQMCKKTTSVLKGQFEDVHTRMMKENYEQVPQRWFLTIFIPTLIMALVAGEGFNKQLQLPWWGILLSLAIAFCVTLLAGVIQATTGMPIQLNVITELIIGLIYPGKPLASVTFKTYGYASMAQALGFLGDLKLGHYMKIPPKSMFIAQVVGTAIASTIHFVTVSWLLTSNDNACDESKLPVGSPWNCAGDIFYNASIIWGVVGPQRMFSKDGIYPGINWFFFLGLLAPVPVWLLSLKFPNHTWIKLINVPVIIGGAGAIPPFKTVNYIMWGIVGIFFNIYVYKKFKAWWVRHTYILSGALDAGIALMGVIMYFAFQICGLYGLAWWGLAVDDYCPLAKCPTAPGVAVEGCPTL